VPSRTPENGSLRAWFAPGAGVRAAGSIGETAPRRLDLYDLSGRRIATSRRAAGVFDVTLPGTSNLGAGIYFLRVCAGDETRTARVAVIP
jgi:hypothetical protein